MKKDNKKINSLVSNGLTSNVDLETMLKELCLPMVGVFCVNTLPSKVIDGVYICNLSRDDQEGTHWVSWIVKNNNSEVAYFDSLNLEMPREIYNFLRKPSRGIIRNFEAIQGAGTAWCGMVCILFLFYMTYVENLNFPEKFIGFLDLFGKDLKKNGSVVSKMLSKVFNEL